MDAEEALEAAREHAPKLAWPEHYEDDTPETARLLDILTLKKAMLQLETERLQYCESASGMHEEPTEQATEKAPHSTHSDAD